jgi:hypothetical protein
MANLTTSAVPLSSKVVTSTFDTSTADGNVAVTGVGFKPTSIIAHWKIEGSGHFGVGMADSARAGQMIVNYANVTPVFTGGSVFLRIFTDTVGAVFSSLAIVSYDADGFTFSSTKTGAPTGTANIYFICYK